MPCNSVLCRVVLLCSSVLVAITRALGWVGQGLTSHSTHFRSFRRLAITRADILSLHIHVHETIHNDTPARDVRPKTYLHTQWQHFPPWITHAEVANRLSPTYGYIIWASPLRCASGRTASVRADLVASAKGVFIGPWQVRLWIANLRINWDSGELIKISRYISHKQFTCIIRIFSFFNLT